LRLTKKNRSGGESRTAGILGPALISNENPNFEIASCTVNLNVDTGNKQRPEFVGQKVDWKYVGSCDKAFTDAVSGMLADKMIQSYMNPSQK